MSSGDELVDLRIVLPRWLFMQLTLRAEEQGMLASELAGLLLTSESMLRDDDD